MLFYNEKLIIKTPEGTITIRRTAHKAEIIERSFSYGCKEKVKTVVTRKDVNSEHYAFGDFDRLKEFYGYEITQVYAP